MPRLIATSTYSYAGKTIKAGDEFEASEKDAFLLKLCHKAIDAEPVRTKRQYRRRDLSAEP